MGESVTDKRNDDEDLMSDFRDLFPDEDTEERDEGESSPSAAADELGEPDELDAFLSEFSEDLDRLDELDMAEDVQAEAEAEPPVAEAGNEPDTVDEPERLEAPTEEILYDDGTDEELNKPEAAVQPEVGDETGDGDPDDLLLAELDEDELDLSVGEPAEMAEASEPTPEQEDLGDDAERASPDAAAALVAGAALGQAASVAEQASARPTLAEPARVAGSAEANSTTAGLRRLVLLSLLISLLAAGGAGGALLLAMGERPAPVEPLPIVAVPPVQTQELGQLRNDVAALSLRLNELAVIIEGPMSHLRQSSEEALVTIGQRLDEMEDKLAQLASRPVVAAPAPSRMVAATAPATTPQTGGWSVNLVSLSSEKDAQAELERLQKLGIQAAIQTAQRNGRTWYRLQVSGFASHEAARRQIAALQQQAGVSDAWVSKD